MPSDDSNTGPVSGPGRLDPINPIDFSLTDMSPGFIRILLELGIAVSDDFQLDLSDPNAGGGGSGGGYWQ